MWAGSVSTYVGACLPSRETTIVVRSVVGNMTDGLTDGGRPLETSTDDVLTAFDARDDPAEPLTASEVGERVDCSRRTALNRLDELAEADRVASKKVGGRARVWWVPLAGEDGNIGATEPTADDRPGRADDGEREPGAEAAADSISAALEGWRPGRSREEREPRRAAGRAAVEYLRTQTVATAADFQEEVEPKYSVEGQNPETWWKNTARPAIKKARAAGLAEFVDGAKEWRWNGEFVDGENREE